MRKLWLFLLAAGVLLPRIYLVLKFRSALIESDEAIVGLMARHILKGEIPTFYWGQPYMGTLEPLAVAALFLLFGATPALLKVTSFLLFCGFLVCHYILARETFNERVAMMATTLVGVSPAFLTSWSLKSRGGYLALLLLGTLALLLANRILIRGYSLRRAVLLGIVLGLAWWTHFLAIVYIVPILLIILLKYRTQFFARTTALATAFLLGGLPFWIYNFSHSMASLQFAGRRQTDFISDMRNFFGTAVPIFLGGRANWSRTDLFPASGPFVLLVFAICIGTLVWKRIARVRSADRRPSGRLSEMPMVSNPSGQDLLLVFVLCFLPLFSASGFAWFVTEPRYLIPLYSAIYILILGAFTKRAVQIGLLAILLSLNLSATFLIKHEEFTGYTNVESNSELLDFLHRHQITRAYAPYWTAYRLTFESDEQIICTPPDNDVVRYIPYLNMVKAAPDAAFIRLSAPRYQSMQVELKPPKEFLSANVASYQVFYPRSNEK
ncbi:MAG TPA: glycosyltransferase family 39 protein [Acidobacteriota bacterium]